jgi:predicted amidohydrolase
LICTEVMFTEWARTYRYAGAKIIAVPRASGVKSLHRWRTAISMAAIVSGCYVLSSNRSGGNGKNSFGGHGMIVAPSGDVLAETSETHPVVAAAIDLSGVSEAQLAYPCSVEELPESVAEANRIRGSVSGVSVARNLPP